MPVRYLRFADRIIALGSDGKIAEQGTFSSVLAMNGYVKSLCNTEEGFEKADEEEAEPVTVGTRTAARESANDDTDKKQGRGKDRRVYAYYYRSIGMLNALGLVLGGICFAVFLKFPGFSPAVPHSLLLLR
jgi:ATP-binding cassette subfamily C (CFTR/MRP) protein 1